MKRVTYAELDHCGRLGNALWQVASTIGLARARNTDPIFPESWSYRPYFSLPEHWYGTPDEIGRAVRAQRLARGMPESQRNYLQSFALIAGVLDEAQACFAPSREASQILFDHLRATDQTYLLSLSDAVTLHVRRGDNLNIDTHPIGTWPLVTTDYYRAALRVIDATRQAPVVIFSDGPDWCRANVADLVGPWDGCIYVVTDGPTRPPDYEPDAYHAAPALDWIDLQLMAMFGRHVIGASTYSTWGALLGPGPTVYPDNWVGWQRVGQVPAPETMVPPEWVQVPNPIDPVHLEAP